MIRGRGQWRSSEAEAGVAMNKDTSEAASPGRGGGGLSHAQWLKRQFQGGGGEAGAGSSGGGAEVCACTWMIFSLELFNKK